MDKIEDADNDIDKDKLAFNFNIFRTTLDFLSAIYNGKTSLREAEFSQRNLEKKIEELNDYRSEHDMLKYRDKIVEAFKDDTFSSEHLKKSDDFAYDYVLEDLNKFIQKIELISENINLSLFEDFFESASPADYAKKLINVKDSNENKVIVAGIKDKISDLKDRIKKMSKKENK